MQDRSAKKTGLSGMPETRKVSKQPAGGLQLRFGPAGMPLALKGKKLSEGIRYVSKIGLDAFEIEFVQGVRIRKDDIEDSVKAAKENDVLLSCHGPYFVNCCSPVKEKQETTKRNLMEALRAANILGAKIVVFHPGFYQGQKPEVARDNAVSLLKEVIYKMKEEKIDVLLGAETTGKPSQYGSLDEVLELCKTLGTKYIRPVIDFGHISSRENGWIKGKEEYEEIFKKIKEALGSEALEGLHCHFSEQVFSEKGERYHVELGANNHPPFKPLAELIKKHKYKFTIISESPLLEVDALKMLDMVNKA